MKKLLLILLFIPLLFLYGDEKKYDQELIIRLWGKTLKEITEIKVKIEKVLEPYDVRVIVQPVSEMNQKWQKTIKK